MNWNFNLIYKSEEDFNKELELLSSKVIEYPKFVGTLNNKEAVKSYLIFEEEVSELIERLYVYASIIFDKNQKDTNNQARKSRVLNVYNDLIEASSFAQSELVNNSLEDYQKWCKEDEFLSNYTYYFDRLHHNSEHILESKLEELMAKFNPAMSNYSELYNMLSVQDNSSELVDVSTGQIEVNEGNFRLFLEKLENQEDRKKVFESVFKFYNDHKNTFYGIYKGIIESDYANAKARNYNSILESFLDSNNIPKEVYLNLLKTAKENTSAIKEYYNIRKNYFGLEKHHTYDRFRKFASTNKEYTYEECLDIFNEMIKDMPDEFKEASQIVLANGRVDVNISDGKANGAYSTGTYKEGPFIMLNHSGSLNDLFTVVHEAGHSIHTVLSTKNQPFATKDYVIFVAEIASTFNEQLLLDYLINHTEDKDLKLVLLEQAIDNILSTFYRQTLFADYEYQAHKLKEEGVSFTATDLDNIMINLYKAYYDIDLNSERYKENVWAYIPHFYHSPFYVYQYATSFAASMAIFNDIKDGKENAMENYIKLLKSGGSDYPINLVKQANVDLTTAKPYLAVVRRLEELVSELKKTI